MKTTIDLPDDLLHEAKVVAAQKRTTLRELVVTGLDMALHSGKQSPETEAALDRLQRGFHLGGKRLTREQIYERR